MKESSLKIPLAIAAAGIIVAAAIYLSLHTNEPSTGSGRGNPSLVSPISASDHILGSPSAPIKVVEYADYDCEFCKQFETTMHQIITNYGAGGKVAWIYRNYPLTTLHPNAQKAAEAAECVAQVSGNDVYWKFADALFNNQPVSPTNYAQYAQNAGADAYAVAGCVESASSTVSAIIAAQAQNAQDIGARGTPYAVILIDGQTPVVIDGAYPYDAMEIEIQKALKLVP